MLRDPRPGAILGTDAAPSAGKGAGEQTRGDAGEPTARREQAPAAAEEGDGPPKRGAPHQVVRVSPRPSTRSCMSVGGNSV